MGVYIILLWWVFIAFAVYSEKLAKWVRVLWLFILSVAALLIAYNAGYAEGILDC